MRLSFPRFIFHRMQKRCGDPLSLNIRLKKITFAGVCEVFLYCRVI